MTPEQKQALKGHLQAIAKILYDDSDPATMQTFEEEEQKRQREAEEARKRQEEQKRQRKAEEARYRLITGNKDYTPLDQALRNRNWKEADQLTLYIMLEMVGRWSYHPVELWDDQWNHDRRIREANDFGWLDEDSIRKFPGKDLKLIDRLWVEHSNGTLGFSVQKRIWQECGSPSEHEEYSVFRSIGVQKRIWRECGQRPFFPKEPILEDNESPWIRFGKKVNWQGGTGPGGWRRRIELDMTDPQKYPGHLPGTMWGGRCYGVAFRDDFFNRSSLLELFSRDEI